MQLVALLQDTENLKARADDARSERVREQVRTAALSEKVNDLLTACCESAEGTAESLSESTGVDIHSAISICKLADTVTGSTYNSCRMRLVHHYESIILLCQLANLVHRCHVTVHGEYTVCDNDSETLSLSFLEAFLQLCHVSIGITISLGLAKTYAVDDGGMVQCV